MTTPRKRPECRTCGMPMVGHKRPFGYPECPLKTSPKLADDFKDVDHPCVPQIGKPYHFVNPHYVEPFDTFSPPPLDAPSPHRGGSWVSTEPADDIWPAVKHERTLRVERAIPDLESPGHSPPPPQPPSQHQQLTRASPSASSASAATTRLRRSWAGSWADVSLAAASFFRVPRDELATVTQGARMEGLYTGVLRKPRSGACEGERRRYAWYAVVGRDAGLVEHVVELQEKDQIARLAAYGESDEEAPAVPPLVQQGVITTRQMVVCSFMTASFCCTIIWVLLCYA